MTLKLVSQYDKIDRDLKRLHDEAMESRYQSLIARRNVLAVEVSNIIDGTDCSDQQDLNLLLLHLEDAMTRIRDWSFEVKSMLRERNGRKN